MKGDAEGALLIQPLPDERRAKGDFLEALLSIVQEIPIRLEATQGSLYIQRKDAIGT